MATNTMLIIVILLIVAVYLSYYAKYSSDYNITQTFLDKFHPNLLYERNPIIIYDTLARPKDLLNTIFKYQYIHSRELHTTPYKTTTIKSKFSMFYCQENNNAVIKLINPTFLYSFQWYSAQHQRVSDTDLNTTNVTFIDIHLKRNQVMILPPHWIIHSSVSLQRIDIHDVWSYTYFAIF